MYKDRFGERHETPPSQALEEKLEEESRHEATLKEKAARMYGMPADGEASDESARQDMSEGSAFLHPSSAESESKRSTARRLRDARMSLGGSTLRPDCTDGTFSHVAPRRPSLDVFDGSFSTMSRPPNAEEYRQLLSPTSASMPPPTTDEYRRWLMARSSLRTAEPPRWDHSLRVRGDSTLRRYEDISREHHKREDARARGLPVYPRAADAEAVVDEVVYPPSERLLAQGHPRTRDIDRLGGGYDAQGYEEADEAWEEEEEEEEEEEGGGSDAGGSGGRSIRRSGVMPPLGDSLPAGKQYACATVSTAKRRLMSAVTRVKTANVVANKRRERNSVWGYEGGCMHTPYLLLVSRLP